MRKWMCYLLIAFCMMFVGVSGIKAASSDISASGSNYVYSWSGLSDIDYVSYTLSCTGGTRVDVNGVSGNTINSASGSVTYSPTGTSLTCSITNGNGEVVTTATRTVSTSSSNSSSGTSSGSSSSSSSQSTSTTTTTTRAVSSNNNLSSITITTDEGEEVELSPEFSSDVYEYTATVASNVETVSVDASMEDSRANLTITGNDTELVAGESNTITITVTAENGTPRSYVINIVREALSGDATLLELIIEECEDFSLVEDTYTYSVKIGKNVDSLTLLYVLSDEEATVEIEGNEDLENGSKVRIIVTAPDGSKRVYTLNIVKETTTTTASTSNILVEKNPLIIMGLSIVAFGLIGGIVYVIKK